MPTANCSPASPPPSCPWRSAISSSDHTKALQRARQFRDSGQYEQAAQCAASILAEDKNHVGALRLLAAIRVQEGAAQEAIACLERALALDPQSTETLLELGTAQLAANKPLAAVATLEQARARRPRDAAACRALGSAYLNLGDKSQAIAQFRDALAILPYDIYVQHMLAALTGEATQATTSYVADLFDSHADQFDQHLTETLHYRIPTAIVEMVADRRPDTVLDLGCGTGLVAAAFGHSITHIDGVDVAPQMIRKARARHLYRHLRTSDLMETLRHDLDYAGPYDLVTAADVFVYLGALEGVFTAVHDHLRPSGLFAFSVETSATEELLLRPSGRFAHAPRYIERIAGAAGFTLLEANALPIRLERSQPIDGCLYLLRRL